MTLLAYSAGVLSWGIALLALSCLQLSNAWKPSAHPTCTFQKPGDGQTFFERQQDISALLHGNGALPASLCVFNPAAFHYKGDIFLWAARVYAAADQKVACIENYEQPLVPVSYDKGLGRHTFLMAVTRTMIGSSGVMTHELLAHRMMTIPLEDPHLFQDERGAVWLLTHSPRGGVMAVTPVSVSCQLSGDIGGVHADSCNIATGGTRILWLKDMLKREKNWVPHNGTYRMSYPVFPTFGPHRVINWVSYMEPAIKDGFDSVAPQEPFFDIMNLTYHGLIEFAGSTPAILYEDGKSYISVGHIRAYPLCFHSNPSGGTVTLTCSASFNMTKHIFEYRHTDGQNYLHHAREYSMFLYRFSTEPPYKITHISHSFVPCTFYDSGIVYPSGLTRIGPDYLISYGEADRYSRVMTITPANMDRLLIPIEQLRGNELSYTLCGMPCEPVGGASSTGFSTSGASTDGGGGNRIWG